MHVCAFLSPPPASAQILCIFARIDAPAVSSSRVVTALSLPLPWPVSLACALAPPSQLSTWMAPQRALALLTDPIDRTCCVVFEAAAAEEEVCWVEVSNGFCFGCSRLGGWRFEPEVFVVTCLWIPGAVTFRPSKQPYDPCWLITGCYRDKDGALSSTNGIDVEAPVWLLTDCVRKGGGDGLPHLRCS
jgi:hypothetical protein